jgi:hypothetical protein
LLHHILDAVAVPRGNIVTSSVVAEEGVDALIVRVDVRQTEELLPESLVAVHPGAAEIVAGQIGVRRSGK